MVLQLEEKIAQCHPETLVSRLEEQYSSLNLILIGDLLGLDSHEKKAAET